MLEKRRKALRFSNLQFVASIPGYGLVHNTKRLLLSMNLKFPDSDISFIISPSYFLGDFDVYDREETLGTQLSKFDPNDLNQLRELLRERFFEGPRVAKLSAEHKKELLSVLERALEEHFDFSVLMAPDINSGNDFSLPDSWTIKNPQAFFTEIYHQACLYWENDL